MKEIYVKPEVEVMEFEVEGVLCGSNFNSDPDFGATAPGFEWGDWPSSGAW